MTSRSIGMGWRTKGICAGVVALALAVLPALATGAPKKAKKRRSAPAAKVAKQKPAPRVAVDLEAARRALAGPDALAAREAAELLGKSGHPKAADLLLDTLAVGANPRVAAAAIDALGTLKSKSAIPVLLHFARNRRADLRRRALLALAPHRNERVTKMMVARLGDSSTPVRAVAAKIVAERGVRSAVPRLVQLLRRGDGAAALALGTLMSVDTARRVAELRGQVKDGLLATTLGEFVKRKDVADPMRVDVIKTLAKIPGPDATAALVEYVGSVPEKDTRPSKNVAQKLIEQRSH